MTFSTKYLDETIEILNDLNVAKIEQIAVELSGVRMCGGRLFVLGVGGSSATAAHAVNDFRKMCGIEAYAPTDNVAELTARTNDDGWHTTFVEWLRTSNVGGRDAVMILSVGGGTDTTSENIKLAVDYAKSWGASVLGIVGRDGGHTAKRANACLVIPPLYGDRVTAHTEGIASVVLHLLVSHPALAK
jgi:D-sedoheptulose 7-phosphate isomerase